VRLDYAGVYLLDKENSSYKLAAARGKGPVKMLYYVKVEDPLVKCLLEEKQPLVYEEFTRRPQQNKPAVELEKLNEQLVLLSAGAVIPSFVENNLLGFLVLGDKRSGAIYSQDDLNVFTVLANQAALAIENARFFEEAKEMQEQISQAEKMATIGTMADGLSHQINNRFHALTLIAGDTLDTLKLSDITNYTPEQKELLGQIKHALERILNNVVQGGEVVKGMLKYTRKGEEGFSAVTLNDIINSTLEMVQYKIRLSELDIIRDYPEDAPAVNGNLTQLQEVFFNLIDNAYDAIIERRDTLKEPGYRGRIRIYTESPCNDYLKINVEDNGIGAKNDDLKKMFTPFFTTKASSRKGTGLGLYVIKKIIASNHQGRIRFESAYKQGTRFILELPLYPKTAQDAVLADNAKVVV
jgi:signal transduction histidine kinase